GLDIRGEGGYVILPPSRNADGGIYERANTLEPAGAPSWLIAASTRKPHDIGRPDNYARTAIERECAAVARATEGTRNDQLNRSAFALSNLVAGGELGELEVRLRLTDAARACGLPANEIARTIASGFSAGMQHPRTPRGKLWPAIREHYQKSP